MNYAGKLMVRVAIAIFLSIISASMGTVGELDVLIIVMIFLGLSFVTYMVGLFTFDIPGTVNQMLLSRISNQAVEKRIRYSLEISMRALLLDFFVSVVAASAIFIWYDFPLVFTFRDLRIDLVVTATFIVSFSWFYELYNMIRTFIFGKDLREAIIKEEQELIEKEEVNNGK